MEGGPSVAKEDGALDSTAGRALVAGKSETSVTMKDRISVAREVIPSFLEPEASVAREDGVSVTR